MKVLLHKSADGFPLTSLLASYRFEICIHVVSHQASVSVLVGSGTCTMGFNA